MNRSGKIGIGWTITLSLLALLIIGALAIAFRMADAGKQVRSEIAAIIARGEPIDVSHLGGQPVPPYQNAANDYATAFAILSGPGAEVYKKKYEDFAGSSPKPTGEDKWMEASKGISHFESVVPIVEKAISKPACKFPVNWSAGAGAIFPHVGKLRYLARYFSSRAIVAAHENNVDTAIKSIELGIGVAEANRNEPTIISLLVRIAMLRVNTYTLCNVMNEINLNEAQAKSLDKALSQVDLNEGLRNAMIGGRALGLWCFDEVKKHGFSKSLGSYLSGGSGFSASAIGNDMLARTFSNADILYFLSVMKNEIDNAALTSREMKIKSKSSPAKSSPPRYAYVSNIITPVFSRVRELRDAAIADIACARVSLGLQAYKSKYGFYPIDLKEMKKKMRWEVPMDPFSGKPPIYKRQSKGFLLYSIGVNMIDEGGKSSNNSATGDIVWRVTK